MNIRTQLQSITKIMGNVQVTNFR